MGTTAERVEDLLNFMREADVPTLFALDRELHLLLEQKGEGQPRPGQGTTAREEFCQRYPHVAVDPDLFALVGVHSENPVEEDKILICERISRRFTE